MRTPRWEALVVLLGSVCAAALVRAQEPPGPGAPAGPAELAPAPRVLVLDPDSPFLTPAVRADLGKQLRALAARYTRLVLVPASSGMTLATLQKKAGCQDADEGCLVAMARAAEVDRLVWSQVQKLPGRSLVVVAAVDGRAGRVVDQVRQRSKADPKSVGLALSRGFSQLFGVLSRTQLKVSANAGGAEVLLDGRRVGQTPLVLTRDLEAGVHQVELRKAGFQTLRQTFELKPGQPKVVLKLTLVRQSGEAVAAMDIPMVPLVPGSKIQDDEGPGSGAPEEGIPIVSLVDPAKTPPKEPVAVAPKEPSATPKEPVPAEPGTPGPVAARPGPVADTPKPPKPVEVLPPRPPGPSAVDQVAEEDVRGQPIDDGEATPVYEKWWFWTILGAVAVAGVVTGLAVGLTGGGEDDSIPDGLGRVGITF